MRRDSSDTIVLVFIGFCVLMSLVVITVAASVQPTKGTTLDQPAVIMEVLDPSLNQYAPLWKAEIARRFPHAVGVLVHGGDFVEGQWIVGTHINYATHVSPVKEVVEHYQKLYPDRTIVLLACNTGHLKLGIPNVYYFKSSVWCIPDRGLNPQDTENADKLMDGTVQSRWEADSDVNGNIYEAVTD